jgi:hypothetical protein
MASARDYDEYDFGFSWICRDAGRRTSHALIDRGRVWLIDPVAVDAAIDKAQALGTIAGVIQLLDRHERDCSSLAKRFGVPHHNLPKSLDDAPFEPFKVLDVLGWREVGLWWPEHKALVVAESLGTVPMFAVGDNPVGLHPFVRPLPPRAVGRYQPEHLLTGHGLGVHGSDTGENVDRALSHAWRDIPRVLARLPRLIKR